jgi:hypothetical protein
MACVYRYKVKQTPQPGRFHFREKKQKKKHLFVDAMQIGDALLCHISLYKYLNTMINIRIFILNI